MVIIRKKQKNYQNYSKQKKNERQNQSNFITYVLEKLYKYQQTLNNYKNSYIIFLNACQKIVEKKFQDFQRQTEELVNNLIIYNSETKKSIVKYDSIIKNNQNNLYNNNNIKQLINEILDMERKYFNKKTKEETKNFFNSDIILKPKINRREYSHPLREGLGLQYIIEDKDDYIGEIYGSCDIGNHLKHL